MSKSSNMLRTRRKDNNVKPNRRLDRKSSRGMLFENEDLRLKTININAEVERGQSDIKKLKRENDQLRREIWYLRDEYDKLDKMLREKECESSSSSTSTSSSESESCSSCSEESEAVETSQNIENFQKTNLKNLNQEFDHLSMVPEENSTENSEKNSNKVPSPENCNSDIIKADESYPSIHHKPSQEKNPKHFFSPIKVPPHKVNDDYVNNQFLGTELPCVYHQSQFDESVDEASFVPHFYPGLTLPGLNKTTTDVIVKTDNHNFNSLPSRSSFSNGGNLEELLNDIETISHDILQISNSDYPKFGATSFNGPQEDAINLPNSYVAEDRIDAIEPCLPQDKPYKSELSVVLMPSPMQLIGVEKYKNIQKSCESLNTARSREHLNPPEILQPNVIISPNTFTCPSPIFQPFVPVPPLCPSPHSLVFPEIHQPTNPFIFETPKPHDSAEYFPAESPIVKEDATKWKVDASKKPDLKKDNEVYNSKTNLLDLAVSSDHVSSENEENLKFKTTTTANDNKPVEKIKKAEKGGKLNVRRRVSIHFKGKKDKNGEDKVKVQQRRSLFRFSSSDKKIPKTPKTPGAESKSSYAEPKTPGADSKASTSDNKNSKADSKNCETSSASEKIKYDTKMAEAKGGDRKSRKSSSGSPERKHKDVKKVHKKHKKGEKNRRNSVSIDRLHRERSFSICTDRSNILDHRGVYSMYDGFTTSDRERTNSLSSCETIKGRKLSTISHLPSTGKIPWCGCWGNGCL